MAERGYPIGSGGSTNGSSAVVYSCELHSRPEVFAKQVRYIAEYKIVHM